MQVCPLLPPHPLLTGPVTTRLPALLGKPLGCGGEGEGRLLRSGLLGSFGVGVSHVQPWHWGHSQPWLRRGSPLPSGWERFLPASCGPAPVKWSMALCPKSPNEGPGGSSCRSDPEQDSHTVMRAELTVLLGRAGSWGMGTQKSVGLLVLSLPGQGIQGSLAD